jgi:hypothetical protein
MMESNQVLKTKQVLLDYSKYLKDFNSDIPVYRFNNTVDTELDFIITKDLQMDSFYQNNLNIPRAIICEVTIYSTLLNEFEGYQLYDYIGNKYECSQFTQDLKNDQIISKMYVRVPVYVK